MSRHGLEYIVAREALSLDVYVLNGLPHIGVGHLLTSDEIRDGALYFDGQTIPYAMGISRADAMALLAWDLGRAETAVQHSVLVPLNDNEFDALVSLTDNIGVRAFQTSALVRLLNVGNYAAVPVQMRRFVHENRDGVLVVDEGLVKRRDKDVALWLGEI